MLTIAQFNQWRQEADDLWNKRLETGAERPHPALEFHGKIQFRKGYMAAMAKVAREKAASGS